MRAVGTGLGEIVGPGVPSARLDEGAGRSGGGTGEDMMVHGEVTLAVDVDERTL